MNPIEVRDVIDQVEAVVKGEPEHLTSRELIMDEFLHQVDQRKGVAVEVDLLHVIVPSFLCCELMCYQLYIV